MNYNLGPHIINFQSSSLSSSESDIESQQIEPIVGPQAAEESERDEN